MKHSLHRLVSVVVMTMATMFMCQHSWAQSSIEKGTNTKEITEKPFDRASWSFDMYSPDSYELFEFVATKSEILKFYTNVNGESDPFCALFDSQKRPIMLCNDNIDATNNNYNCIVGYRIIEGDTYYLGVREYSGEAIPECEIIVETTFMAYGQEVSQPETATDLDLKTLNMGYNDRTIPAINSGSNWDKTDTKNYELFEFVPQTSGKYSFSTVDYSNTMGILYNSNKEVLKLSQYVDSNAGNNNFILSRDLVAGQKYYIGVRQTYGNAISKCRIAVKTCTDDYGSEYEDVNSDELVVGKNTRNISKTPFDADKWRFDYSDTNSYNMFKFVAPQSTRYNFRTEGKVQTLAVLFDDKKQPVWMSEKVDGSDYNFNLSYEFISGKTYYLGVRHAYGNAIANATIVVEQTSQTYGEKFVDIYAKTIVKGVNTVNIDVNQESLDYNSYASYSSPQKYEMYTFVAPKSEKLLFHLEGDLHAYAVLFDKNKQPLWRCEFEYAVNGEIDLNLSYDVVAGETYYFGVHRTTGRAQYVPITVETCTATYGMAAINANYKKLSLGTNYHEIAETPSDWNTSEVDFESPANYDLFEFVATESCKLSFSTEGVEITAMHAMLMDANLRPLWKSEYVDDETDRNMRLSYNVVAGKKYYLGVRSYWGNMVDYCRIVVKRCSETYGDGVGSLYSKDIKLGSNERVINELPARMQEGAELKDKYQLFKFVVPAEGHYLFYTTGEAETDAFLFDRYMDPLCAKTKIGGLQGNNNSALTYDLRSGDTYYLGVAEDSGKPLESCNIVVETCIESFGEPYRNENEEKTAGFTLGNQTIDPNDYSDVRTFDNYQRYLVCNNDLNEVRLVLDNFEYEGAELQNGAFISCDPDYNFVVELKGKNRISITDAKFFVEVIRAGTILFDGDGTLEINISDKVTDGVALSADWVAAITPAVLTTSMGDDETEDSDSEVLKHFKSFDYRGNVTINNSASQYAYGMTTEELALGSGSLDIHLTGGKSEAVAVNAQSSVINIIDAKCTIDCKGENSIAFNADNLNIIDADIEANAGRITADDTESIVAKTRIQGAAYKVIAGNDKESAEEVNEDDITASLKKSSYMHSCSEITDYEDIAIYDDERSADFFETLAKRSATECTPANVTVMRTFSSDELTTLCLPFDVTDVSMFDVVAEYVRGGVSRSFKFEQTDHMKAGIPYLVLVKKELVNPTFKHVMIYGKAEARTVKNSSEVFGIEYQGFEKSSFIGTYTETTIEGTEYYYDLGDDKVYHPIEAGQKIKGLRGYFASPKSTDWLSFTVDGYDGRYVSIEGINDHQSITVETYNLQGQRVSPDTKGIVIRNGKKVVNR